MKKGKRFVEQTAVKGTLRYKVMKNGVEVERVEESNLIVNGARVQMAHLIAGDVEARSIVQIAVGTNGEAPTVTDTEISEAFVKAVEGFEYPAEGQVQINWKLQVTEANGMAISEFGLVTADGTLFARRIREHPIYKEADISIEGEWIIIF
jgi:hypothetical protein